MKIGSMTLREGRCIIIEYDPQLRIVNLDQLAHGTGARYLEVVPHVAADGHTYYVAKGWTRKTGRGAAFIKFRT